MDSSDAPEAVELVARRVDFLEALADEALHKADIVDRLDHSRSTVDRAIRDLEAAGFVERITDGYVTTQTGRLAAERYRAFVDDERTILGARDVLEPVPYDWDLPVELLSDAEVASVDGSYRLLEVFVEQLDRAERVRIVLPSLVDSRLVRACHAGVVGGDLELALLAPPALLTRLREEFPYLMGELGSAAGFTAFGADVPPFGMVLAEDGDGRSGRESGATTLTLLTADGDDVAGFVRTDATAAVEWAQRQYGRLREDATEATAELRDAAEDSDLPRLTETRLPRRLRSEGFVRVDEAYFERREPLDPATSWRAGPGLVEVEAGRTVDRTRRPDGEDGPTGDGDGRGTPDGERTSMTEEVLARLQDGEDVALIGPPGAGKSTLCKRVACAWRDVESGPVLYRESGLDQPFASIGDLEAMLERQSGRALVVVEDAVRAEANAVFEVLEAFGGRDDAVFLLDAREAEWNDPEAFPADARLRALRQEAIETVRMPPLEERDCRRLIDRVEATTGRSIDVAATDLLADVRATADGDAGQPGAAVLVFHRLARYVDPLGPGEKRGAPTTLDEDVDRTRRTLEAAGETARDVGVLLNLLNVAGIGAYPAYLHALAAAGDGDHHAVREALDRLDGRVLFRSAGEKRPPYRTIHGSWSARFLERLLAAEGEAAAQRRFGRCVSALLSLADDLDRRAAVANALGGATGALDTVVTDPAGWADETVERVFGAGREYPKLAPLFGTTGSSAIDLPDACSPATRLACSKWRSHMYALGGELDRAEAEARRLIDAVDRLTVDTDAANDDGDAVSAETGARFRVEGLLGRSKAALQRGDWDELETCAERGLALAEDLAATPLAAECRLVLGKGALQRGQFDRAEETLSAALETFRAVDDRLHEASALATLGSVALERGDYADAREYFERSRSMFRSLGKRDGQAHALQNLGRIARVRGDTEAAREHCLRGLEFAREIGDRTKEAAFLGDLGSLAYTDADLAAAERYYERTLELARSIDRTPMVARTLGNLGNVALDRGDLASAMQYYDESLERQREWTNRPSEATTLCLLSLATRASGDLEAARSHAREALTIAREIDADLVTFQAQYCLGFVRMATGALVDAAENFERARDVASDLGVAEHEQEALALLAEVTRRLGDLETAAEYAREARAGDAAFARLAGRVALGRIALDRNAPDAAGEHFTEAERLYRSADVTIQSGRRHYLASLSVLRARAARRRNDVEAAEAHRGTAVDIATDDGYSVEAARCAIERGALARRQGRTDEARAALERAREDLADAGATYHRTRALLELGRLDRVVGDPETARRRLAEAVEQYREMGADRRAADAIADLVDVCDRLGDREAAVEWCETGTELASDVADFDFDERRTQIRSD